MKKTLIFIAGILLGAFIYNYAWNLGHCSALFGLTQCVKWVNAFDFSLYVRSNYSF